MSMFDGIGDAIRGLYYFAMFAVLVLLPLAIWKLVDIGIWFFSHVSWQASP